MKHKKKVKPPYVYRLPPILKEFLGDDMYESMSKVIAEDDTVRTIHIQTSELGLEALATALREEALRLKLLP